MARQCNRKNMTKLVEALESGEYQQARGFLRTADGFCCLGVAGDLAVKEGIGSWRYVEDDEYVFLDLDKYGELAPESGNLPDSVAEWLGVPPEGNLRLPARNSEALDTTAIAMNDDHLEKFPAIAAEIRRVYLTD